MKKAGDTVHGAKGSAGADELPHFE
jgi:hypothetical protein